MSRVEDILTFWFDEPQDTQAYCEERRQLWFGRDPQFDQDIRDRFIDDYQLAAERQLMDWQEAPRSALALLILLDQFPRNMFREDPRAFATDPLAREVATLLVQTGTDRQLLPVERMFVYLPFMHSESLAHQQESVALFQQLAQERSYLDSSSYALRHQAIIERFGRFPHRNASLGRPSTVEEHAFLQQPESSV
ncbi:MAG: DUF924 domain-containing protein [Deltaproteobacteria bacterium]|nr:DUF924 domain-containing protein [Deltaproteobacteria bacterium]